MFYIKDVLDDPGFILKTKKKKTNILCEYIMIKKSLREFLDYFNCSFARYIYVQIESELS